MANFVLETVRMTRHVYLLAYVVCLCVPVARADVVHMKDGRKLEGKVLEVGEKVRLKVKFGVVVLKQSDIVRMDREVDRSQEYEGKVAQLSDDDANGHYELGLWCKGNGIRRASPATHWS